MPARTWSIELNIGSDDPVGSIALHVRGTGDDVLVVIVDIATAVGGGTLDFASGDFLTNELTGAVVWHSFQQFRDGLHHG